MMMHNAKRKNIKCKNSTKHIVVCNRIVKRGIPRGTQSIVLGATNAGDHRVRRKQNASFRSFAARRDFREVSLFTRTSYAQAEKKAKTEGRKSHRQATENAPLAQKKTRDDERVSPHLHRWHLQHRLHTGNAPNRRFRHRVVVRVSVVFRAFSV